MDPQYKLVPPIELQQQVL
jgi:hypothetical protein